MKIHIRRSVLSQFLDHGVRDYSRVAVTCSGIILTRYRCKRHRIASRATRSIRVRRLYRRPRSWPYTAAALTPSLFILIEIGSNVFATKSWPLLHNTRRGTRVNLAQAYAILKINRAEPRERIGTRSYHRYLKGVEGTLAARNFSDSSNSGNRARTPIALTSRVHC